MPLAPPATHRAPLGLRYSVLRITHGDDTDSLLGYTSASPTRELTAPMLSTHLRPALDQIHATLAGYLGELPAALTTPLALDDAVRAALATTEPVTAWLDAHDDLAAVDPAEVADRLRRHGTDLIARSLPAGLTPWHPDAQRLPPLFTTNTGQVVRSALDELSCSLYLRALDAIGDHLDELLLRLEDHWTAATAPVHDALAAGITRQTTSDRVVLELGQNAITAWRALNSGDTAVRNVEHLWRLRTALIHAAGCYLPDADLFDPDEHTRPAATLPSQRTRWLSRLAVGHVVLTPTEPLTPAGEGHTHGPRGQLNPLTSARTTLDPDELAVAQAAADRAIGTRLDPTSAQHQDVKAGQPFPTDHDTTPDGALYRRLFDTAPAHA